MAQPSVITSDMVFTANVTFQGTNNLKAGSLTDAMVSSTPNGTHGIDADKLQARESFQYSQTGTAAAATLYVGPIKGTAATLDYFAAALCEQIPSGDHTVTLDVLRSTGGGAFASVLSATVVLDSANTLRVAEAGTVSAAGLVAGDMLKITAAVAGASGTQPQGLCLRLRWKEDAI